MAVSEPTVTVFDKRPPNQPLVQASPLRSLTQTVLPGTGFRLPHDSIRGIPTLVGIASSDRPIFSRPAEGRLNDWKHRSRLTPEVADLFRYEFQGSRSFIF